MARLYSLFPWRRRTSHQIHNFQPISQSFSQESSLASLSSVARPAPRSFLSWHLRCGNSRRSSLPYLDFQHYPQQQDQHLVLCIDDSDNHAEQNGQTTHQNLNLPTLQYAETMAHSFECSVSQIEYVIMLTRFYTVLTGALLLLGAALAFTYPWIMAIAVVVCVVPVTLLLRATKDLKTLCDDAKRQFVLLDGIMRRCQTILLLSGIINNERAQQRHGSSAQTSITVDDTITGALFSREHSRNNSNNHPEITTATEFELADLNNQISRSLRTNTTVGSSRIESASTSVLLSMSHRLIKQADALLTSGAYHLAYQYERTSIRECTGSSSTDCGQLVRPPPTYQRAIKLPPAYDPSIQS